MFLFKKRFLLFCNPCWPWVIPSSLRQAQFFSAHVKTNWKYFYFLCWKYFYFLCIIFLAPEKIGLGDSSSPQDANGLVTHISRPMNMGGLQQGKPLCSSYSSLCSFVTELYLIWKLLAPTTAECYQRIFFNLVFSQLCDSCKRKNVPPPPHPPDCFFHRPEYISLIQWGRVDVWECPTSTKLVKSKFHLIISRLSFITFVKM